MTIIKLDKTEKEVENKENKYLRKVAGYARVSTDKDEQFSSYEAQLEYFSSYIQNHPGWEFVGMYADEGITGTCTRLRAGFQKMVEDAIHHKIDLIVTKSLSRFARNTVDSLLTIRKLKEVGCECYFEKENIYTFDSKGELLITIMSSLAQEEARSISENVTWGMRKRISDGKYTINCKGFLGYRKNEVTGTYEIDEEEAKIVKEIYYMKFEGYTDYQIAKMLTEYGFPTPTGKGKWYSSVITSILQNEKYTGDALLQKSYSVDFLTKKRVRNRGEVQQFYVENGHPQIISHELYDEMQAFLRDENNNLNLMAYSIRKIPIVCGICGYSYVKNQNHKDSHIPYYYRCRCNRKKRTNTPGYLKEEDINLIYENVRKCIGENRDLLVEQLQAAHLSSKQLSYFEMERMMTSHEKRRVEIDEILRKHREYENLFYDLQNLNNPLNLHENNRFFSTDSLIVKISTISKKSVNIFFLNKNVKNIDF